MPRPRTLALLYVAGAAVSAFTITRGIDPFDEGFVLASVARVTDGQVPYTDFVWPYGPGHLYLLAGASDLFGESLLWWRILRVACDAGVALLVFALAARALPRWVALVAWACAVCAMAQPVSANPFPVALLFGLAAFAVATTAGPVRRPWLWAALLVGAAAAWRLDFGIYAGGAVLVALLLRPEEARGDRARQAAAFAVAATLGALAVYAPFLVAAGPADLYDTLVATGARERDYWTLPFPLSYDGSFRLWPPGTLAQDGKDLLGFYVPLLACVGLALCALATIALLRGRGRTALWQPVGLLVLGAGAVLYLLSRADEFHASPAIVVLAVLLPLTAAASWGAGRVGRALALAAIAVLGALTVYGVSNRASALLQPQPYDHLDLAVADGVEAAPRDARALPEVVGLVRRLVPPGAPIYATTARSDIVSFNDPLLYVLTDRPNVLDRDVGLFARPAEQRRIVARLRARRPRAVIRWTDPISYRREPNLRGRPSSSLAVDTYLARAYRPVLRRGYYVVLVPRG